MPGRTRRVEEGAAHLVELLDELEPAQLEPEVKWMEMGEIITTMT